MGVSHNGVELAEERGTASDPEDFLPTVKDSATQASGRLVFFRAAFNSSGCHENRSGKDMEVLSEGANAT